VLFGKLAMDASPVRHRLLLAKRGLGEPQPALELRLAERLDFKPIF
jgi:hypothetical protein